MMDFLRRHIPWVFSGIGVVILVAIWKFFSQASHTSESATPSTHTRTAQEEQDHRRMLATEAGAPPDAVDASGERPLLAPSPVPSASEPDWKQTAAEVVERIRREHDVKPMEAVHNELEFSRLPRGVFGYVFGDSLHDIKTARVNYDKAGFRFEVHKMRDGRPILIGFASPDTA